jgi:hypothetical protein
MTMAAHGTNPPSAFPRSAPSELDGIGRGRTRTAFVLAGGGSFGAVQVGTRRAPIAHGVARTWLWTRRWGRSIAHQLVTDLERYGGQVEIVTVPPLIERAAAQTRQRLERGGLAKHRIPGVLRAEGTLRPVPGARRRREFSH